MTKRPLTDAEKSAALEAALAQQQKVESTPSSRVEADGGIVITITPNKPRSPADVVVSLGPKPKTEESR